MVVVAVRAVHMTLALALALGHHRDCNGAPACGCCGLRWIGLMAVVMTVAVAVLMIVCRRWRRGLRVVVSVVVPMRMVMVMVIVTVMAFMPMPTMVMVPAPMPRSVRAAFRLKR